MVDDRTGFPFGRRAVDWELKGVPSRLELGPRDLAAGQVTVAHRLPGGKGPLPQDGISEAVVALLAREQTAPLEGARVSRDARTADVATVAEAVEASRADGPGCPGRLSGTRARIVWPSRRSLCVV